MGMRPNQTRVRDFSRLLWVESIPFCGHCGPYTVHPRGESVVGTCRPRLLLYNNTTCTCPPSCRSHSPMSSPSAGSSSSIFKDGKLKPGIYKIQNLHVQTYMDIHEHSREVCCRLATTLEEGRGRVRLFQQPVIHVSDDQKWEIKPLGVGYSVRRVSVRISFARLSKSVTVCLTTRTDRARETRAVLCPITRAGKRGSSERNPVSIGLEARDCRGR